VLFRDDDISNRSTVDPVRASVEKKSKMPLKKIQNAMCAAAAQPFSRPRPTWFCGLHISIAFSQLKKYSRRWSEPVAAPTFDNIEEESEADEDKDDEEEEQVDEEEFLAT
jgi:hypothetical protein